MAGRKVPEKSLDQVSINLGSRMIAAPEPMEKVTEHTQVRRPRRWRVPPFQKVSDISRHERREISVLLYLLVRTTV